MKCLQFSSNFFCSPPYAGIFCFSPLKKKLSAKDISCYNLRYSNNTPWKFVSLLKLCYFSYNSLLHPCNVCFTWLCASFQMRHKCEASIIRTKVCSINLGSSFREVHKVSIKHFSLSHKEAKVIVCQDATLFAFNMVSHRKLLLKNAWTSDIKNALDFLFPIVCLLLLHIYLIAFIQQRVPLLILHPSCRLVPPPRR